MNKKKLSSIIVTAIVVVALIVYAAYLLVGMYSDVLFTAQDRNMFAYGALYLNEHLSRPFGLFEYVGGYLTQFYYYPALGAAMLIAIWTASAFAGIKAFRLKGIWQSLMIVPPACLLLSQLDLGYWVYCLTIPGYWFSQSVAFLCLMLLLWAANATPRRYHIVWYVVVGFVLFPTLGWISYFFTACFFLSHLKWGDEGKSFPSWVDCIGIVVTATAPFVFRALFYDHIQSDDALTAGFPIFRTSTDSALRPAIPFFVLIGATVVASFGRVLPAMKKIPAWTTCMIVGVACSVYVWKNIFNDENYLYEIQMTQATMNDDWKRVVSVAEKTKTPSRTMVMLKNIALLNTGQLGTRSFELGNSGREIYNPDSLNLSIMHIAGALCYYNHGVVNYGYRWCMEFAIPYGFSPYYLKIMTKTAEVNGEKKVAQRYKDHLHSMLFYSDWQPKPASPVVKELANTLPEALDNDENNCERYLITRFSKEHYPNSKVYCELSLLYSVIMRDPNNYLASLFDYVNTHPGVDLPIQYQEAYVLFKDQAGVDLPVKVNISPDVTERYGKFMNDGAAFAKTMTKEGTGEAMFDYWADTYWWFNAFGRDVY